MSSVFFAKAPMTFRRTTLIAAVWVALASASAHAMDGFAVEGGGGDGVDMGRIGVQWDWKQRWLQGSSWHLGGYWDVSIGQWHRSNVRPGERDDITEIALTPVFRIQPNDLRGPYVEAAIGFHLLSHSSIGDKRMSTKFQFGDHIGAGYRLGAKGQYELGYRFQHLSNGSIKRPNPGINFHEIRLQYHF